MRTLFLMLISLPAFANDSCEPDFNVFLTQFGNNKPFQHVFTQYPLPVSYLDLFSDDEPTTIYDEVSQFEIEQDEHPIFPIDRAHLTQHIEQNELNTIVILKGQNNGIYLAYTFSLLNNAFWVLTRFDNSST